MQTFDIITIGSATRDVFLQVGDPEIQKHADSPTGEELCLPLGSKIEVQKITLTSGGGGSNTAVTFARQGLQTACVSVVGNDANGQEIIAELEQEGAAPIIQKHTDGLTAYSVVLVMPNGERTILSYKGEGQHFAFSQIPWDALETQWLYLDSLGGHYDLLEKAVAWAKEKKVNIATNPGGKELAHGLEKLKPLLENASIVSMNQEEAAELLGVSIGQEQKIFQKMDELVKGIFVLTKGPKGVSVSDGKTVYTAGTPDSPVVERTGAGDAFCSGFVVEYIRSADIAKAIQFGTANASSVVTQIGAKAGILKKGEPGEWSLVEVFQK